MEHNKSQHKNQPPVRMEDFHWVVYGICVSALMFIFGAIYLITRVVDNNWSDYKLPTILVTLWLVLTVVGAMYFSLFTIKIEMKKESQKSNPVKETSK